MEPSSEASPTKDDNAGENTSSTCHEQNVVPESKEMNKLELGADISSIPDPTCLANHPSIDVKSAPSNPADDMNKNPVVAQNSPSSDSNKTLRGSEEEEEKEKHDGVNLSEPLTFTSGRSSQRHSSRPNVILLGRGNSFSLGRSEVILLHNNRESRTRNKSRRKSNNTVSSDADGSSVDQSSSGVDANENFNLDRSKHNKNSSHRHSSPPPISNGALAHVTLNGDLNTSPHGNFDVDELEMLWRRAEMIMAEKKGDVQQVLEQFGIGEVGGEGEVEDERATEEESVWHAVQDNFQV